MGSIVGQLSLDECDVLMKYIYFGCAPRPASPRRARSSAQPPPPRRRSLGQPEKEKQYATLLKLHPVVLKRAGQASIVRVISEVTRVV